MAHGSPQEKKALSYAKDRRNDYGENDKSSRKHIRQNKRTPNRADRHRQRQVMASATGRMVDLDAAERAEVRLYLKKSMWFTKRWRKWPDAPLGDMVILQLRRRAARGMVNAADSQACIERIRGRIR
ncbi:hypothetical protein [Fodinicola feengrottensis]|uniref:Uncharacterized protein n=1 Tax=Fodinicola feengrottensis TaxID=435914 RepID=A0ABP4V8F3_9ACTN|nr:hypothetical protein [Fodinicola feengrottensis]